MRNHSQRSRNKLRREGAWFAPKPGRKPGGAKNREMKPASSSMPSDWKPEKSCAAATNDKKQTRQTVKAPRGHRLKITATEASRPSQVINISAWLPAPNQRSVGANQKRCRPG